MVKTQGLEEWLKAYRAKFQKEMPIWTARRISDQVKDIAQAEIVRPRMGRHPPDLMLAPEVGSIGVIEFNRGAEAIAAGRAAVRESLEEIELVREHHS